jgi:hypothetical protein
VTKNVKLFIFLLIFVRFPKPFGFLDQSGKLIRKPSGGERAWFLEEESEPRNKVISLAGGNHRADVSAYPTVSFYFM